MLALMNARGYRGLASAHGETAKQAAFALETLLDVVEGETP